MSRGYVASVGEGKNAAAVLLASHFVPLLTALLRPTGQTSSTPSQIYADWTASSPRKAAFEVYLLIYHPNQIIRFLILLH